MTDFGASFIKARKSAGLSLAQIAVETRISTRFLKAIEDEEFHLLPGGVFNRGFVRAYADRIGLDPEKAVADYEQVAASRQPSEPLETTVSPSSQPKVPWLSYPVVLGVLLLVLIIFYMVARDSVNTALPAIEPQVSISQPLAEPALPAGPPTAPPPQEVAPPTNALTLELEAREQTWIKITTDGSALVAGEILKPGMTRKFTAMNSIHITVGNAGGLTMKLNGQQLKPLGESGRVRQLTITPENLKDIVG